MAMYKQGANGPVGPADRLDGGSVPDRALSSESGNSIANDVVTGELNDIKETLDELDEHVTINASATDTYGQAITALFNAVTISKVTKRSRLVQKYTTDGRTFRVIFDVIGTDNETYASFVSSVINDSGTVILKHFKMQASGKYYVANGVVTGASDRTANALGLANEFTLYY